MKFEVKRIGKETCLRVKEGIDTSDYSELGEIIKAIYDSGVKNLVVNLGQAEYISSGGLGVLIKYSNIAKDEGKTFKLASISQGIRELLKITNIVELLDIYESEKEALESLEQKGS